jgi:hypothetical protein
MTDWLPKNKKEHKVTFYVPSRTPEGAFANGERGLLIDSLMRFLLRELKGATLVEAKGYFLQKMSGFDCEDVKNLETINQMANSLAIEFKQECNAMMASGCYDYRLSVIVGDEA